jgi:hypothetical protein
MEKNPVINKGKKGRVLGKEEMARVRSCERDGTFPKCTWFSLSGA